MVLLYCIMEYTLTSTLSLFPPQPEVETVTYVTSGCEGEVTVVEEAEGQVMAVMMMMMMIMMMMMMMIVRMLIMMMMMMDKCQPHLRDTGSSCRRQ